MVSFIVYLQRADGQEAQSRTRDHLTPTIKTSRHLKNALCINDAASRDLPTFAFDIKSMESSIALSGALLHLDVEIES